MNGYFGFGVEGVSKVMNAGALFRTAHAFGAAFVFTVGTAYKAEEGHLADTSKAAGNLPVYEWDTIDKMRLPKGCSLVGVELTEEAIPLPSFRHPRCAAYIVGPERGSLSPQMVAACDHVIKIPMRFCVNLAVAGAVVMYDRLLTRTRFPDRPVVPGGPLIPAEAHQFGSPIFRRPKTKKAD